MQGGTDTSATEVFDRNTRCWFRSEALCDEPRSAIASRVDLGGPALGLFWGIRSGPEVKAPAAAQTNHAPTPCPSLVHKMRRLLLPHRLNWIALHLVLKSSMRRRTSHGKNAMEPADFQRGDLWLLPRKPGFHDRVLHLKPRLGLSIQRHEVLVPLQADRKQGKSAARRQTLRMNDVKRFFCQPHGGVGQVDIPDTYRIVD